MNIRDKARYYDTELPKLVTRMSAHNLSIKAIQSQLKNIIDTANSTSTNGRPTVVTEKVMSYIKQSVEGNITANECMKKANISRSTYYKCKKNIMEAK